MSAVLATVKCIHMPSLGLKHCVRISDKDVTTCSGNTFIRLAPRNLTLKELVCENNPKVPHPMPHGFSLSRSLGLQQLMDLRNQTQADSLRDGADVCCLWDDEDNATPRKRKSLFGSMCRDDIDRMRHETGTIGVEVASEEEKFNVEMLRPVHPRDNIFVRYDADTLGFVLRYIRDAGFGDVKPPRFDEAKGVCRRSDALYIARYVKINGQDGYKSCKSKDGAIAFMAEVNTKSSDNYDDADSPEPNVSACASPAHEQSPFFSMWGARSGKSLSLKSQALRPFRRA